MRNQKEPCEAPERGLRKSWLDLREIGAPNPARPSVTGHVWPSRELPLREWLLVTLGSKAILSARGESAPWICWLGVPLRYDVAR
jgi:hypothetical protein